MREVKAIAVYDPSGPWEKSIQDAAKKMTGNWLPAYPCQSLAKAVMSLQCDEDWLDREELMPVRASYFFWPNMLDKQELVLVTHLLFLRDILEHEEINIQLHDPITFMSRPLAHFLFRHCPVHLYVDGNSLKAANRQSDFLEVGGFTIVDSGNISVPYEIIKDIVYLSNKNKDDFHKIRQMTGLDKAAAQVEIDNVGEETLYSMDHFRTVRPDDTVWDKQQRMEGTIIEFEPSLDGIVRVKYNDGSEKVVEKQKFDSEYVVVIKNVLQPKTS